MPLRVYKLYACHSLHIKNVRHLLALMWDTLYSTTYPKPLKQSLFGWETIFPSSIIVNTKTHADLIVENESPNQTKDQLQVTTDNITTTWMVGYVRFR